MRLWWKSIIEEDAEGEIPYRPDWYPGDEDGKGGDLQLRNQAQPIDPGRTGPR